MKNHPISTALFLLGAMATFANINSVRIIITAFIACLCGGCVHIGETTNSANCRDTFLFGDFSPNDTVVAVVRNYEQEYTRELQATEVAIRANQHSGMASAHICVHPDAVVRFELIRANISTPTCGWPDAVLLVMRKTPEGNLATLPVQLSVRRYPENGITYCEVTPIYLNSQ